MIATHLCINDFLLPISTRKTMNSRLTILSALLIGLALSSCYPLPVRPTPPGPTEQLTPEQQRLQSLEEQRLREIEADLLRQQNRLTNPNRNPIPNPIPVGPTDYPFASKVPGKAGFVFSPYNKQVVDVRDIPSGTLVQDPTYPASEKKYFRVP